MVRRKSKEPVEEMVVEGTDIQVEDQAVEAEVSAGDSVEIERYHEPGSDDPQPEVSDSDSNPVPVTDIEPVKSDYPYEHRLAERKDVHVKAVVQIREEDGNTWKEIIEIKTVSKNGAALLLPREVPIGRLVSLALQMPQELRAYDLYTDVYAMAAVVQNCSPVTVGDEKLFHVGVAFIGKKIPDSFKTNPSQTYRITGMSGLGLWSVTEAARKFVNRKSTRFWRRFEVSISIRDRTTRSTSRQSAMTRDVSLGGMSVWGPLDAKVGDRVKISSKEHDFFGWAIVRNRTEHADDSKTMIHFEFDGMEFPVARIQDVHVVDSNGESPELPS